MLSNGENATNTSLPPQHSCRGKVGLDGKRWPRSVLVTMTAAVQSPSRVRLFVTLRTIACQAPLSMGFSRQEHWSGLPFPPPGHLPDPRMEPHGLHWQAGSLPLSHLSHHNRYYWNQITNEMMWSEGRRLDFWELLGFPRASPVNPSLRLRGPSTSSPTSAREPDWTARTNGWSHRIPSCILTAAKRHR